MEAAASDLRQTVLNVLKCPVCNDYMLPPIYLCVNGHNICKICKPKLQHCPNCGPQVLNLLVIATRCLPLEKLAAQVEFPCTYQKFGCPETSHADRIMQHQAVCPYGTYSCPLKCKMRLTRELLLQHVREKHKKEFHESSERLDYIRIQNYDVTKVYTQVIVAHDEVFVRTIRVINGTWHFLVQYIGPEKCAQKFRYKVSFDSKNEDILFIKIGHCCRSINENANEIYRTCKCIMLPTEVVKCTIHNGELGYYFQLNSYM
jgi:E3 ubiquitin-protein ligase SIAH1